MIKEFTGRMAFLTFTGFFVVIISVNMAMSYFALGTFPGLEVENSYVASQEFNGKLAQQMRLGWRVELGYDGKTLSLDIRDRDGQPAKVAEIDATIGRATTDRFDRKLSLVLKDGRFIEPIALKPGKWEVRFVARAADGTAFQQRKHVIVKP